MPPDIPVAEVRYYPPMAEQAHGHHWHSIPITVLTLLPPRGKQGSVGPASAWSRRPDLLSSWTASERLRPSPWR